MTWSGGNPSQASEWHFVDELNEPGKNDLSFSTTDMGGRITAVNGELMRRSKFTRDQLMHAPHNVLRNPAMPNGIFRVMWDLMLAGRPFCGYMDNRTADGTAYRVFSTITPIEGGFLSVRQRPMRDDLRSVIFGVYGQVRPREIEARAVGATAAKSAEIGGDLLRQRMPACGFADYEEFIWAALPGEMEARAERVSPLQERPEAAPDLAGMLKDVIDLTGELRAWSGRQSDLGEVAAALTDAVPHLEDSIGAAEQTVQRIGEVAEGNRDLAPILLSVTLWAAMMREIRSIAGGLLGELAELRVSSAKTRFRIALARLHTDAMGQFVNDIIDDADDGRMGEHAIPLLGEAVSSGIRELRAHSDENSRLAGNAEESLNQLVGLLGLPQGLIRNWRGIVEGRAHDALTDLIPIIERQLEKTDNEIAVLLGLANHVSAVAQPPRFGCAEALLLGIEARAAGYAVKAAAPH